MARDLTDQELRDAQHFAIGNVVWVLYHEIGHLLIEDLQLPILGSEEDAADNLSTIMLLEARSAEQNDFLVAAVDAFFLLGERSAGTGTRNSRATAHRLDRQRAFQTACLMYGSSPQTFASFADTIELPQERRDTCPYEFQRTRNSWMSVLNTHRTSWWSGGGRVTAEYLLAENTHIEARNTLLGARVLDVAAEYVNSQFTLSKSYVLRGANCGAPNAHFEAARQEVVVCYELYEFFFDLLAGHFAAN